MRRIEVVRELELLCDQHGGKLSPLQVVEAATPIKHPLHDYFTWDNDVAAHEWRLHEARKLLRVRIEIVLGEKRVLIPAFTSDPAERALERASYVPTRRVFVSVDLRAAAVEDALDRLLSWWGGVAHLEPDLPRDLVKAVKRLEAMARPV